ncbi:T9SS type A sorting domain-containing protein [Thalassobellus sediminis]|uniref:T9SS type A sorting domain-containing protein n=1 Tax=Thalassobellus sediminis TaxID=3367753 RepID=UPI0037971B53
MKKINLFLFILTIGMISYSQTSSTGIINLSSTNGLEYTAQIDITSAKVTLTLIGPDDRWLALGFGTSAMSTNKDVVIFTGTTLTDRTFTGLGSTPILDNNQDWTVTSNTVTSGKRTLVATRVLNTGESNDYVFSTSDTSINLVWARGNGATFNLGNHGSSNRGATSSGITLSIDDNNLASNFSLFPNPTSSKLNIVLPNTTKKASINAFDILGKQIFNKTISNLNTSIDVSSWSKGIYLIKIFSEGKTSTKKFIKE